MTRPGRSSGDPGKVFFGHPRSLRTIVITEAWERFAQYGMQTLLVLYLVGTLLQPGHIEHVFGFPQFRAGLEAVLGPLSVVALASAIYGIYGSAIFLSPIFGGLLADRYLGKTRTVIFGSLLMLAGHVLMTSETLFLPALLLLILGVGCFKGNLATQIGALYPTDDGRRANAFHIYSLAINAGVIAAPLVAGTLGERLGWRYGFAAAGAGMLIGLAVYLAGRPHLPPDPPVRTGGQSKAVLTAPEKARTLTLLLILPPLALAVVGTQQVFNAYLIWANRSADLWIGTFHMPTTWLISIDMVTSVLSLLAAMWFWNRLARRGLATGEVTRMIVGCGLLAAAYMLLAGASALAEADGGGVGLGPLILYHLLASLAFAHIFPVSLALFARTAPATINSTMMGIYYLHLFAATAIAGWIGGWLEPFGASRFWLLHAVIPVVAAALFLLVGLARRRSLSTA
ncbi:peptide MFS transporter [Sphingosinicella microcystinivorans]|uniref:peptide MFS transporter n=1 Tax=Sphingosinicella microcystinivorans TaxID=335406 RepID=UPI0022F38340|nr:oligopeptide:H+ symporter [Sphingosinicella microcystinivorans]WBX85327.1 oligopeptide:H+ symporter [Sphingosinicella microcystinivorans]